MEKYIELIVALLSGLAACIPLVVQLVKYIKKAVQEKNWNQLLSLIMSLMEEAEKKFETGADRKEWVLTCIKASSDQINYDIDMDEVSKLIDSLCNMTKVVNGKIEEATQG